MALTLKELREKLKREKEKSTSGNFVSDGASYPFWDIEVGGPAAVIRFLPDGDETNPDFWRERMIINLPFEGVIGLHENSTKVQVPCMEMWGEKCPVLEVARRFYKNNDEESGRTYWKKRSFLYQGFVRQNPLAKDVTPENPIRRFTINPKLQEQIVSVIMDEDMEDLPTDYNNGLDFRIQKTLSGGFNSFATSNWSRKTSSLTEEEIDAVEKFGLFNLSEFLPKKPDDETLAIIEEMLEASLNGEAYDPARFGKYYRPYGLNVDANGNISEAGANKAADGEDGDETVSKGAFNRIKKAANEVSKETATDAASDEAVAPWEDDEVSKPAASGSKGQSAQDLIKKLNSLKKNKATS